MIRALLPWLALGAVEVAFSRGGLARPGASQLALEVGLLLLCGAAQARLLPAGPWKSAAIPGVLAVAGAAILYRPPGLVSPFVYFVGVIVLAAVAVRVLTERLRPGPFLGVILAILGGIVGRYAVLGASRVQDARVQLAAELSDAARLPPAAGPAQPPILLISVDTLRWDHAVEMESYRSLAARGQGWPRAMASSSWTLPSMVSVHTGLPAHAHGARKVPGAGVSAPRSDAPWLAAQLSAAGWQTGAIVTNPYLSAAMGFDAGFRDWLHVNERAPHRLLLTGRPWGPLEWEGELVAARALDWIEAAPEGGWFLWVHFLDPHLPYRHAPPGHVSRSGSGAELRSGLLFSAEEQDALRDAYAHEVSVVDALISDLIAAAPQANVILVSDHGEEWWDHGAMEHGHSHHGEVVDVALAIAGPSVEASEPDGGVAAVQDVYATVLGMAGLPAVTAESVDLRQGVPHDRIAVASGNLYVQIDWSARQGDRRVIARGDGRLDAYELAHDPTEQVPLPVAAGDPLLGAIRAAQEEAVAGEQRDQNAAALRALGYLE